MKKRSFSMSALLIALLVVWYSGRNTHLVLRRSIDYEAYSDIASKIIQETDSVNFHVSVFENYDLNWHNPGIWFFLEKMLNKKLLSVVNYGNNLEPVYNAELIYLVCAPSFINNKDIQCRNTFKNQNQNYFFLSQLITKYPEYSLYKYTKKGI